MRRLAWFAILVATCFLAAPAFAQGLRISQPAPNCDLTQRAFDNPFSDTKGYWQPRIAWHAEYAVGTAVVAWTLNKVTPFNPLAAALAAHLSIGIVPHVRSVLLQRRYPINPGDLLFDAVNRATPYVLVSRSPSNRWKAFGAWLASDLVLSCFSSP